MTSLQQEMRQRFEKHSSMAFYENNSNFEEGLLEKIMNLAYANLFPYSSRRWSITAVKSPVLLQKLYKVTNDKRIAESAIALIICGSAEQAFGRTKQPFESATGHEGLRQNDSGHESHHGNDQWDLEMLALSIGYAAKYYCMDYFMIQAFDIEHVSREFALDRQQPAAAIICLGYFRDKEFPCIPSVKNLFSDTVRIL